jgi:hypothetical protein
VRRKRGESRPARSLSCLGSPRWSSWLSHLPSLSQDPSSMFGPVAPTGARTLDGVADDVALRQATLHPVPPRLARLILELLVAQEGHLRQPRCLVREQPHPTHLRRSRLELGLQLRDGTTTWRIGWGALRGRSGGESDAGLWGRHGRSGRLSSPWRPADRMPGGRATVEADDVAAHSLSPTHAVSARSSPCAMPTHNPGSVFARSGRRL